MIESRETIYTAYLKGFHGGDPPSDGTPIRPRIAHAIGWEHRCTSQALSSAARVVALVADMFPDDVEPVRCFMLYEGRPLEVEPVEAHGAFYYRFLNPPGGDVFLARFVTLVHGDSIAICARIFGSQPPTAADVAAVLSEVANPPIFGTVRPVTEAGLASVLERAAQQVGTS